MKVLVIKSELVNDIQGIKYTKDLKSILNPAFFMDKDKAETDENFKQLIPFIILRYNDFIYTYIRGTKTGEKRLHGSRSLAVGGHIDETDKATGSNEGTLINAFHRELEEEVKLDTTAQIYLVGLLNNNTTPVDKVHLGIVYILDLEKPLVKSNEEGIIDDEFMTLHKLKLKRHEFETWGQICIDQINKITKVIYE